MKTTECDKCEHRQLEWCNMHRKWWNKVKSCDQQPTWSESPTVQNVFAKELSLIKDRDIHEFVTDVFGFLCPKYFWYIPASVRNHHPPICRQRGGLVHHVKLVVTFADTFLDMKDIYDDLRVSQTIAAVLLHDMMKRGDTENEEDTWPNHRLANRSHGRYCANRILEYLDSRISMQLSTKLGPIVRAVRLHMGRWTQGVVYDELYDLEHDIVVRTTHLADYAASRALHHYLAERHTDESMRYLK